MAQFFSNKRKAKPSTQGETIPLTIDSMDHRGNGLCLSHKPIVVVDNAVSGEQISVKIIEKKKRYWQGRKMASLAQHAAAVKPFCQYVGQCGGCSHQAFDPAFMLDKKQQALASYLAKQVPPSRLHDAQWEPSISSERAYRRRAKFAVDARNPAKVKIGYRQAQSNKVVDIQACPILQPELQQHLTGILACLRSMPSVQNVGHITYTAGHNSLQLCLHLIKPLSLVAKTHLKALAQIDNLSILTQVQEHSELVVGHEEALPVQDQDGLSMAMQANNFLQVNQGVNKHMLVKAQQWLSPAEQSADVLIDLFAGCGNFSLALAAHFSRVIGCEGRLEMVQQARQNALSNGIENASFAHVDLENAGQVSDLALPKNAVLVVDPSRIGAKLVMSLVGDLQPTKILYVSCNPSSFIRDLEALPDNYRISRLCALDMFPFTKHIELMSLIERQ